MIYVDLYAVMLDLNDLRTKLIFAHDSYNSGTLDQALMDLINYNRKTLLDILQVWNDYDFTDKGQLIVNKNYLKTNLHEIYLSINKFPVTLNIYSKTKIFFVAGKFNKNVVKLNRVLGGPELNF